MKGRLTIHGAVFWTVMCGAFYAAPYSNLFFLLLGFLTLLGLGGVVGARRNMRDVKTGNPTNRFSPRDVRMACAANDISVTSNRPSCKACQKISLGLPLTNERLSPGSVTSPRTSGNMRSFRDMPTSS